MGRVFYTAWGHEAGPGHLDQEPPERGIRWAGGGPASFPPFRRAGMTPRDCEAVRARERTSLLPAGPSLGRHGRYQDDAGAVGRRSLFFTWSRRPVWSQALRRRPRPICMAWDERGRLWIAETIDYPNELSPGAGRDRIRSAGMNGDGRAESSRSSGRTSLPTSITFARGRSHRAPATGHALSPRSGMATTGPTSARCSSRGGDGRHARRRSSLRYGLGNWVYGIVGYSGYRGEVGRTSLVPARLLPVPAGRIESSSSSGTRATTRGSRVRRGDLLRVDRGEERASLPHQPLLREVRGWSSSVLRGIAGNPRFQP
jgi:hypothetical protein